MRYGLLGGAFDPVHKGHLSIAQAAYETLHLDQVFFVASAHPPHRKTPSTPFEQRIEMLRLAVQNIKWAQVSEIEKDLPAPTYTLSVLKALSASLPTNVQWFLIIGSDNYQQFKTWNRWQELLELSQLVIYPRDSENLELDPEVPAIALKMPILTLSSTKIRQALNTGKDFNSAGLLPSLENYVTAHGLYRNSHFN